MCLSKDFDLFLFCALSPLQNSRVEIAAVEVEIQHTALEIINVSLWGMSQQEVFSFSKFCFCQYFEGFCRQDILDSNK